MHSSRTAFTLPTAFLRFLALALVAALAGCASFNSINAEVSSFSRWPAGRAPGSFAFERLPSQQTPEQDTVEAAARTALESAGFTSATGRDSADVLVQVTSGNGISTVIRDSRDGPFWYGGGAYGRGFWGPGFGLGFRYDTPVYEFRVDLVLRDRRSNEILYETHARHERVGSSLGSYLLQPLAKASMDGFPSPPAGGRHVTVLLPDAR